MTVSSPALVLDFAGRASVTELRQTLRHTDATTPVTVVVPAGFGMADRRQLATDLDPDGARQLTLLSSALAAVYGHHLGKVSESSMNAVLCLDLRRGWSAGLVRVEPSGLTEVAAWGASPDEVAEGTDDDASRILVDHLMAVASTVPGTPSVSAALLIDDDGVAANSVRRAFRQGGHDGSDIPVFVKRARQLVAKGAAVWQRVEGPVPSVGALARALAVLADDGPEQPAMHVIAAEHSLFPSSTRLTFDLGPSDGSPLHFDVFEQERRASDGEVVRGRAVLRANLVRERGYDRNMVVTFELGSDGLFTIGPSKAWSLDWEPGVWSVESTGDAR
jgi:hypothetical protein